MGEAIVSLQEKAVLARLQQLPTLAQDFHG